MMKMASADENDTGIIFIRTGHCEIGYPNHWVAAFNDLFTVFVSHYVVPLPITKWSVHDCMYEDVS